MPPPTAERFHAMDALRAAMMLAVVVLHASMFFSDSFQLRAIFRFADPEAAASRIDFAVDTRTGLWRARLSDGRSVEARGLVNAAGPWVAELLGSLHVASASRVRLVKGSHIVVPRLFDGNHAYILQQPDRRIVFAIPYERDFTEIGTTDVPVERPGDAVCTDEEVAYLCDAVNRYFTRQIGPEDIVWKWSPAS